MWAAMGAALAIVVLGAALFFSGRRQGEVGERERLLKEEMEKVKNASEAARKVDELSDADVAQRLRDKWGH